MQRLKESARLGKVEGKRLWNTRIIAQGAGSSGFHSESALQSSGPAAWPAGTKVNMDHASFEEWWDRPEGSLKTLVGIVSSTPEYRQGEDGVWGLYADVEFSEEAAPFVEQFAEFIGLSITSGYLSEGETADGLPIVKEYLPSPFNTVDLVTVPGADGKLIFAKESAKAIWRDIISNDTVNSDGENNMTPEEVKALLAEALAPISAALEALKPEVVENEVEESVSSADIAKSVIEADLPEAARERVFEALAEAKTAEDVTKIVAREAEYVKKLSESKAPAGAEGVGVVQESGAKPAPSVLTVSGW